MTYSMGIIQIAIFLAGIAALSWEVIWQHYLTLALGVSGWGTALTLAVTMGGMGLGSLLALVILKRSKGKRPALYYCACELVIAVSGFSLPFLLNQVELLDRISFQYSPSLTPIVYSLTLVLAIGPASLAMGFSLPIIAKLSSSHKIAMSLLYGLNTLGAACGALILAFFLIPRFGVRESSEIICGLNLLVAVLMLLVSKGLESSGEKAGLSTILSVNRLRLAFITGFVTLALEVAWFRALRAAFRSTTETFAILLAAVLIALGLGSRMVHKLRLTGVSLSAVICWAGILALAATPLVERVDLLADLAIEPIQVTWLLLTLLTIGPALLLLGIGLPWIFDEQTNSNNCAKLYAVNTVGGVLGALLAGWVLLPTLGFSRTACLLALLLSVQGLSEEFESRKKLFLLTIFTLLVAMFSLSGVGRERIVGHLGVSDYEVLAYREAPEASVAVVELKSTERALVIDGFHAATELSLGHYMSWMGHLPMLLQHNPKSALVICFGTGQTANAVRNERPLSLDIVDVNSAVFGFGNYFSKNENVLLDPIVSHHVMDGRAYLRRVNKLYDVITLEPMPPNFAGVNSLYSKEFYELAAKRLTRDGAIAQWVTFRLVSPHLNASVVRTFLSVFPDSYLWIDPTSNTGIVVGRKAGAVPFGESWPGLQRIVPQRDLSSTEILNAIALRGAELERYGHFGIEISDDNQKLAFGSEIHEALRNDKILEDNLALVAKAR